MLLGARLWGPREWEAWYASELEQIELQVELEKKFASLEVVRDLPACEMLPGESCVAQLVLDGTPAVHAAELKPLLGPEDGRGAEFVPFLGGSWLAHFPNGSSCFVEPASEEDLGCQSPRMPLGILCHTAATIHAVCGHNDIGGSVPSIEYVKGHKSFTYIVRQDYSRFAPVAEGRPERTLLRRSVCCLDVTKAAEERSVLETLNMWFENENRRWIERWSQPLSRVQMSSTIVSTPDCTNVVVPQNVDMLATRVLHYDRDLVTLAKLDDAEEIHTRIEDNGADMNAVIPDKLEGMKNVRYPLIYIEERTALIAAVEGQCDTVFNLLLSYEGAIDLNVVCLEWTESDWYKRYTVLDAAKRSNRRAMTEQLLKRGAKLAEELPEPTRCNPFDNLLHHFPKSNPWTKTRGGGSKDQSATHAEEPQPPQTNSTSPSGGSRKRNKGDPQRDETGTGEDKCEPVCSHHAVAIIKGRLNELRHGSADDRKKLWRQLCLEWHPDKRPYEEELATHVFQWLQQRKVAYLSEGNTS